MGSFNSMRTVVVSAVLIALVAATAIHALGYWARQAAHAELLLVQVRAALHELSSVEWQAISKGAVDAGMEDDLSRVTREIDTLRRQIKGSQTGMREFNAIYGEFTVAMEQEFDLITVRKLAEAHDFDESVVDPLFDRLHDKIRQLTAERSAAKERISVIADTGMLVALLSAALIVATMFAVFTASRSRQTRKLIEARELAELSSDSTWEQDEHFRFTSISTGALDDGLAPPMIGATLWELPVDPAAADWAAHRATLEAHRPFKNFEYKLLCDGMPAQWISSSGKPQFDADDNFKGYRGTTRNITERKQAEEALSRSRSDLRQLAAYQERAKEEERKRIARDIHDELGQNLMALRLDVVRMSAAPNLDAAAREQIDAALGHIDTAIKNVRGIINDLRPSVLDLGLHAAIQWQAKEFERRSGIACDVYIDHAEFSLDDQRATALFRSVQESLSNIIRHAQASQVWIDMQRKDDQLTMKIVDDGIGAYPNWRGKANSFGLIGIEERMHAVGGTFATSSEPDLGMTVMLAIPLRA